MDLYSAINVRNVFIIRCAIVEELVGLGAAVHTCSRSQGQLDDCLSQWQAKGFHQVTGSICDVSSSAQREELINKVSSQFNEKLNILISTLYLLINFSI